MWENIGNSGRRNGQQWKQARNNVHYSTQNETQAISASRPDRICITDDSPQLSIDNNFFIAVFLMLRMTLAQCKQCRFYGENKSGGFTEMLTLLFSICMAQIAELEKRRRLLWGLLTFLISAAIQFFLVPGYWGAVSGFFMSYGTMTYINIKYPVNKGVTLGYYPGQAE